MSEARLRMGKLDPVHIRVPDRAEAAQCYATHLGFDPVEQFDFWATGFEGGPLQISAHVGRTMLALFEASNGHPMIPQRTGVAFSVDAATFITFARSLPGKSATQRANHFGAREVIDFDIPVLGVRSGRSVGQPVRTQLRRLRAREAGPERP